MSQPETAESLFADLVRRASEAEAPTLAAVPEEMILAHLLNSDPGPHSGSRGRYAQTKPVADAILDLFNDRYPDMHLTTRQTFYQCAQTYGVVEKSKSGYRKVRRLLVLMRRSGEIDDERVVDRSRSVHRLSTWASPVELMRQAAIQFRRDLWQSQPIIPLVGVEKQALEAIFTEAVDEFGAALMVNKGYASEHYYLDWAKQIAEYHRHGKQAAVLFFADFDPSGCDAEVALRRHVDRHLQKMGIDPGEAIASWRRVALTYEEISAPDFVRLPVNGQDKRTKKYVARYGDGVGELDALEPPELQRRIREPIERCITDPDAWERLRVVEAAQRESLDDHVSMLAAIYKNRERGGST